MGETNFHTREIPRSGSKAKDGERGKKREKKKKRLNDGDNNGQATHGARKHAWRTQAAWAKNAYFFTRLPFLNVTYQTISLVLLFLIQLRMCEGYIEEAIKEE